MLELMTVEVFEPDACYASHSYRCTDRRHVQSHFGAF